MQKTVNQCRHGDAHYIAPSAPFHGRACCKRYKQLDTQKENLHGSLLCNV